MHIYERLAPFCMTVAQGQALIQDPEAFPKVYFYPLDEQVLVAAETRLGFAFPPELRRYYTSLGVGSMQYPPFDSTEWGNDTWLTYWNDLLHPMDVAKLYTGRHRQSAYFRRRAFSWCDFQARHELPFMQFDEVDFIAYKLDGSGMFRMDTKVADTVAEFMQQLADNPQFYLEGEET